MRTKMTEARAAGKWCPFSRVTSDDTGGSFNRFSMQLDDRPRGTNCIGRECTAFCDDGTSSEARYYCGLVQGG